MPSDLPVISQITAPAKINLCLNVTGRRDDGYHLLDSIIVFAAIGDVLDIQPAPEDSITLAGPFAGQVDHAATDNICARALRDYREAGGRIGPLAVHIEKHIPVGAGLGGGSADAAALLRWLQAQAKTPLAQQTLFDVAGNLGADVPACLTGKALRMRGIGDRIEILEPAPTGPVLLASPGVFLSTAQIFRALASSRSGKPPPAVSQTIPAGLSMQDMTARGNDLQGVALSQAPAIGTLLDMMALQDGAKAAQMTGSGSACFAVFETAAQCDAAATRLVAQGLWAVSTTV